MATKAEKLALQKELKKLGIATYGTGEAFFIETETLATLTVGKDGEIVESSVYAGAHSFKVVWDDGEVSYVQLAAKTKKDAAKYKIVVFTAARDWEERGFKEGQKFVWAIAA